MPKFQSPKKLQVLADYAPPVVCVRKHRTEIEWYENEGGVMVRRRKSVKQFSDPKATEHYTQHLIGKIYEELYRKYSAKRWVKCKSCGLGKKCS